MGIFEIEKQHLACQVQAFWGTRDLKKLRFNNCEGWNKDWEGRNSPR